MQEACTHVFRATFYMFLLFTYHSDSLLTIIFTAALLLIHIFILKMFIERLNTILVKNNMRIKYLIEIFHLKV